jgi:hypothetical protein
MEEMSARPSTAPCPVKECGARVILAEVGGEAISLDPVWIAVAIAGEGGAYRLVRGLQPHAYSCVDIAARRRFRERVEQGLL